MRVSLQWLRELVEAPESCFTADALAERLSVAGFEVESIDDLAAQARGVTVGLVCSCERHPDADKLSVCKVDVGAGAPLQIVCGAPNVRAGIHVAVAMVGSTLPAAGLTIKATRLRGVASSGMICSLAELGLADGSSGIAVLEEMLGEIPPLGTPIAASLGLDDVVLELAITANRPDGLSMLGIAREVAALCGGRPLAPTAPQAVASSALPVPTAGHGALEAGGVFSITAIDGLRVEASPLWLQRRLERAGIRPINTVVDITNLVMLETGQPLHAYDQRALAAIGGSRQPDPSFLGVRPGRSGEQLQTLDDERRLLTPEALLVTYADRPIALAGVMGGRAEAVSDSTTAIWLEAAVFDPQAVRRSARSLGLRSEASARFEKGLPAAATLAASDRAAALLEQLAGGTARSRWVHQRSSPPSPPLTLRRDAVHQLLGPVLSEGHPQDLGDERIVSTLEAIGCQLSEAEEGWSVQVPPSRMQDLRREVDLIEEVARLVGYDRFAAHLPDPLEPGGLDAAQQVERLLRRGLCAAGLQEACSFSLVPGAPGRIPLANPLLTDYGHLRDELHSELLQAARRNLQTSRQGFWAFEIGRVFRSDPSGQPRELTLLTGLISGERRSERWSSSGKTAPLDYWQARGQLQAALEPLRIPIEDRESDSDDPEPLAQLLHPGRSARLSVEGRAAGWFGQLHPGRCAELELPAATYLFQLPLDALVVAATRRNRWQPSFTPFPTVPSSDRDLALVVPEQTSAAALLTAIRKAGRPLLERAELIDRYSGDQLPPGTCSQAFRLRYRDSSRTLTDGEVEAAHAGVRMALERQFGAQLRS